MSFNEEQDFTKAVYSLSGQKFVPVGSVLLPLVVLRTLSLPLGKSVARKTAVFSPRGAADSRSGETCSCAGAALGSPACVGPASVQLGTAVWRGLSHVPHGRQRHGSRLQKCRSSGSLPREGASVRLRVNGL